MSTFGERLKKEREMRGISQQELANRLNLSQSSVAYYEKDRKQPSQNTLTKIADFFDLDVDYLLGRTEKPQQVNENTTSYMSDRRNDADTTIHLLEKEARKLGLSPSDPKFLEMLSNAFDLLRIARGQDKE